MHFVGITGFWGSLAIAEFSIVLLSEHISTIASAIMEQKLVRGYAISIPSLTASLTIVTRLLSLSNSAGV